MTPNRKSLVKSAIIAVAVIIGLTLLWRWLPMTDYLRHAIRTLDEMGPTGYLVFYVIYVVCALVGIPRTLLNLGAGVLFEYVAAVVVVLLAAATAYTISFWVARTLASDWVEQRVRKVPKAEEILSIVEEEGFKFIFLVRMNPFIPGVIKGYGFGTTRIPFRTYLAASILGFLPLLLAHVYLGWVGGEAILSDGHEASDSQRWMIMLGLLASAALVGFIYWYGKRALNQKLSASNSASKP